MFKAIFIFLVLIHIDCNSVNILDEINVNELKKEWIRSMEEETDSIEVYRPRDYQTFPPTWFREIYAFEDNNKCKYLVLAPNDAHYFEYGNWELNQADKTLIIIDSTQQLVGKFEIVSITKNILKLIHLK